MSQVIPLKPKSKDRVMLGYITDGWVRSNFLMSIFKFGMYDSVNRKIFHSIKDVAGLYIAQNRNQLINIFLKDTEANWLLCLDTDIEFDPDIPYKLLDAADPIKHPIVSALYFTYVGIDDTINPDTIPLWSKYKDDIGFEPLTTIYANEVQPIDACGFGCVLIHRSVFEKFQEKYEKVWTFFGHDPITYGGEEHRLGEDYTFCRRCMELGIPIHGHGGAVVTHLKVTPLNLATIARDNRADLQPAKEEANDFIEDKK